MVRVPRPSNFKVLVVPFAGSDDWGVIKFLHKIIARRADIEVEAPIGMVVVDIADTRTLHSSESESRPDRSVRVQAPFANITVPARLHFADQYDFLALHINRN